MRIIGGKAGGIRIEAPEGYYVRPTNDLVKESLFNTLGDIEGSVVLDLFSGSGALGLEALSRGAKCVIFIEREARGVQAIKKNLGRMTKNLEEDCLESGRVMIFQKDVVEVAQIVERLRVAVDLILADPPYGQDEARGECAIQLLQDEELARLTSGALLVLEHADRSTLPWKPHTSWKLLKQRKFGNRCLSFARNGDRQK